MKFRFHIVYIHVFGWSIQKLSFNATVTTMVAIFPLRDPIYIILLYFLNNNIIDLQHC